MIILVSMDSGQAFYVISRLALGALVAFFAIMLWSKTRDIAWMLMVIGAIAAYVETVYAILTMFGIAVGSRIAVGSLPLAAIILPNLPLVFFLAAFIVMVVRKYRK